MLKLHSRQRELTPLHIAAATAVATAGKGRIGWCVSSCRPYVVMRTWSTSFCSWMLIQILQARLSQDSASCPAAELMSADDSPPGVYNYRASRSELFGSTTAPVVPLHNKVAHRCFFQPCDCAAPVTGIAMDCCILQHFVVEVAAGTRLDAAASPAALTVSRPSISM